MLNHDDDHRSGLRFPKLIIFFKNGSIPITFCLFSSFSHDKYSRNTINEKRVDGVLGTQTWGCSMEGTDESTELWQHPRISSLFCWSKITYFNNESQLAAMLLPTKETDRWSLRANWIINPSCDQHVLTTLNILSSSLRQAPLTLTT